MKEVGSMEILKDYGFNCVWRQTDVQTLALEYCINKTVTEKQDTPQKQNIAFI